MADLAIIVPTRGRPQQFADLVKAVQKTAAGSVEIWAGLDDDDPADYSPALHDLDGSDLVTGVRGARRSLSAWTNFLAERALSESTTFRDAPRYLASLGDDHRPRSNAWDKTLIGAIEAGAGYGFAYGNDLFQGANLPTAWVVSADVVRAVGWMMLPACNHMYVDNAVLELGKAAGCITYRPDVIVEHLHPVAGKGSWDASYRESNSPATYGRDLAAFEAWRTAEDGLARDVGLLRERVMV
jgi:hypothetical protein